MNLSKKDFFIFAFLAGLVLLFFNQALFTEKTFCFRDFSRYFYPVRFLAMEGIKNGQFPLWNPYSFCGIPFLANLQSGIFYPLSILCYLFPFTRGLTYFAVIHFLLGGIFMYLLMRSLRSGQFGSFLAAVVFAFSGYLISVVDMLTTLTGASWLPLLFLVSTRAQGHKSTRAQEHKFFLTPYTLPLTPVLLGIVLGLQFLGGIPEVWLISLVCLAVGLIFVSQPQGSYFSLRSTFSSPLALLLVSIMVVGLVGAQLFPALELFSLSTRRAGGDYLASAYWSLAPRGLLTTVFASFFGRITTFTFPGTLSYWGGQTWLKTLYIGIIPLVLVGMGIFSPITGHRSPVTVFIGLFALSFLLAFGRFTPIYWLFYKWIPGFQVFRYPVKFMLLAVFLFSIFVGRGLDFLSGALIEERQRVWRFLKFISILIIILAGGYFAMLSFKGKILLFLKDFYAVRSFDEMFQWVLRVNNIFANFSRMLFLLGLSFLLIFLVYQDKLKVKFLKFAFGLIVIIDLFVASRGLNPLISEKFYTSPNLVGKFLNQPSSFGRVIHSPKTLSSHGKMGGRSPEDALFKAKQSLYANYGFLPHIFDAYGYGSIILQRYQNFIQTALFQSDPREHKLLNLLNVRHVFSKEALNFSGFRLLAKAGEVNIYRNEDSLPRAFLVAEARELESGLLEYLLSDEFSSSGEVVIQADE